MSRPITTRRTTRPSWALRHPAIAPDGTPRPYVFTGIRGRFEIVPLSVKEGAEPEENGDEASPLEPREPGVTTETTTRPKRDSQKQLELLAAGAALSWPRLQYVRYAAIQEGEESWRKFAAYAAPEHLELALEHLAGTVERSPIVLQVTGTQASARTVA